VRVKAKTEKNFKRAAAKPGRRKPRRAWVSWRLLRAIVAIVVVSYAVYRASTIVANASVLKVSRISVHGNVRLSSGEVEQLANGLYGSNILLVDLARYRRVLLESPWVAEVTLRRVLPSTVEVFVSERRPFGVCRLGSSLYLIDRTGAVIDEFGPRYAEFDLPIVDGLVRAPRDGRAAIDEERAALAARVIDAMQSQPHLARRISQIDVSDLHDAVVMLDDDTALLHLGEERFLERLRSYTEVADTLRERVQDIDYVDLRFEERMYVKPRQSSVGSRQSPVTGR
jgi:cell division septal protein FtsQ